MYPPQHRLSFCHTPLHNNKICKRVSNAKGLNNLSNKRGATQSKNDFTKGVSSRLAVTTRTGKADRTGYIDTNDHLLLHFLFDFPFFLLLCQMNEKKHDIADVHKHKEQT